MSTRESAFLITSTSGFWRIYLYQPFPPHPTRLRDQIFQLLPEHLTLPSHHPHLLLRIPCGIDNSDTAFRWASLASVNSRLSRGMDLLQRVDGKPIVLYLIKPMKTGPHQVPHIWKFQPFSFWKLLASSELNDLKFFSSGSFWREGLRFPGKSWCSKLHRNGELATQFFPGYPGLEPLLLGLHDVLKSSVCEFSP